MNKWKERNRMVFQNASYDAAFLIKVDIQRFKMVRSHCMKDYKNTWEGVPHEVKVMVTDDLAGSLMSNKSTKRRFLPLLDGCPGAVTIVN